MVGYRQWQLPGDPESSSVAAQDERLLDKWQVALGKGKEVVTVMDANLDALTWRNEPHTIPRHSTSMTQKSFIDNLHDRILPMGVELMTPPQPTCARADHQSCLDHVYTTSAAKLPAVSIIWTGMSDHAALKFHHYIKSIQNRELYVRKRMFKKFNPILFKKAVSKMPKLQPIMSSRDVDMAATLLTLGLAPTLDKMAPNKTMYTKKNSAQHMGDQTKMLQAQQNSEKIESGDPEDWRAYRSLRYQTTASLKGDGEAWRKSKLCRWSAVKRILN